MPKLLWIAFLVLSGSLTAQDPLEIVRKSVDRDQTEWELAKDYTYVERANFTERDSKGNVKKTEGEASEVLFLHGERYERLIEKNGKPLSEKDRKKEQERLDKFLADRARDSEEQRRKRQEKGEKQRARQRDFAKEIPEAFTFQMRGEEVIDGHRTWVIDATPKPGFKPRVPRAGMLSKFRGTMWIEQAGYHLVKLEAEAIDTVSFGLFLARIGKGTRFGMEQMRVNDEIWMPRSVQVTVDARLALLKKIQGDVDVRYEGYRKFQSDSRIVSSTEVVQ